MDKYSKITKIVRNVILYINNNVKCYFSCILFPFVRHAIFIYQEANEAKEGSEDDFSGKCSGTEQRATARVSFAHRDHHSYCPYRLFMV